MGIKHSKTRVLILISLLIRKATLDDFGVRFLPCCFQCQNHAKMCWRIQIKHYRRSYWEGTEGASLAKLIRRMSRSSPRTIASGGISKCLGTSRFKSSLKPKIPWECTPIIKLNVYKEKAKENNPCLLFLKQQCSP